MQDTFYVKFERTGGFAGIAQSFEMKSDTLSEEERNTFLLLLNNSDFFQVEVGNSSSPDQFNYKIEIEHGEKQRTLQCSDSSMPQKIVPLVDHLNLLMRKSR